jgi:hypothetical protein
MSRSSAEWYRQPQKSDNKFAAITSLPQPAQIINGVYTTIVQPFGMPTYGAGVVQPFKPIPLTGKDQFRFMPLESGTTAKDFSFCRGRRR